MQQKLFQNFLSQENGASGNNIEKELKSHIQNCKNYKY